MTGLALQVRDLRVAFDKASIPLVDGVSFDLAPGEILGLVGESGSGKSLTSLALMRLLPDRARLSGDVRLNGRDLVDLSKADLEAARGGEISMVFQNAMSAFNPVRTVGWALEQSRSRHFRETASATRAAILAALKSAGIPDPARVARSYPHQLSGGFKQRAMIALALVNEPTVLLADEPTTALDATVQLEILDLLRRHASRIGIVLVTHDFGVAAEICDRIAVMYRGSIVEVGPAEAILARPQHPYTKALVALAPRFDGPKRLMPIPGAPPVANEHVDGCAFRPRCERANLRCATKPIWREGGTGGLACWNPCHD